MTPHGVFTVAKLEFKLRIRAGRWRWLVASWFVLLLAVTALVRMSLTDDVMRRYGDYRGAVMFGVIMLVVLALALLVAPALSAQSVNGDRERGTLATLQVTRLSATEIALGKLLAAWGTALVFLAVTLPLALWCFAEGGLSGLRVLGVYSVMALLLGIVAALSLALSALLARTTTSGVLAYLTVFALSAGTFIAFGLATALTQEKVNDVSYTQTVPRMDRTWWVLSPNPFAILADSAPAAPTRTVHLPDGRTVEESLPDPLGAFSRELHRMRVKPQLVQHEWGTTYEVPDNVTGGSVWPTGLVIDGIIALGAVIITSRRLRTPTYRLARGQRIA
jgi:ABC-2 type transport system permease protein